MVFRALQKKNYKGRKHQEEGSGNFLEKFRANYMLLPTFPENFKSIIYIKAEI